MNKTEVMHFLKGTGASEIFDHSIVGQFDITATVRIAIQHPEWLHNLRIADILPFVEQYSIDRKHAAQLPFDIWNSSAVIVIETDSKHYLIDGIHRIIRRHNEGEELVVACIMPIELAVRPKWKTGQVKVDWDESNERL